MKINLNETVKVKLNGCGKDIYYHQFDVVNKIAGREVLKPKYPKEDENGYSKFQLWDLFNTYGPYMGMAQPIPFEHNEIIYEESNLDVGAPKVTCAECKYADVKDEWEIWCNSWGPPYSLVPKDGFCFRGRKKEA